MLNWRSKPPNASRNFATSRKRIERSLSANPTDHHKQVSGDFSDNNATLCNALGQKIKTARLSPGVEIPLDGLSQGVYFLKAEGLPTKLFFKL